MRIIGERVGWWAVRVMRAGMTPDGKKKEAGGKRGEKRKKEEKTKEKA